MENLRRSAPVGFFLQIVQGASAALAAAKGPRQSYGRGLYAGSFDGMHYGHMRVIAHASLLCETLLVVVMNNVDKVNAGKYAFSLEERVSNAKRMVARLGLENVEVVGYEGLLVDLYLQEGCDAYIRGIRKGTGDRKAEEGQAFLNTFIYDGADNPNGPVNMVYLECENETAREAATSSTLMKEFAAVDVPLPWMAPAETIAAVLRRRRGVVMIGVVGGIAVGKSTVVRELVQALKPVLGWQNVRAVNFDGLLHRVYGGTSRGCQRVRDLIAERFGEGVLTPDRGDVNRAALRPFLFGGPDAAENLAYVTALTEPHVMAHYREEIRGRKGVIFVEMAQMVQARKLHLVSNQVIVIDSEDADRLATETDRGLDLGVVRQMRAGQWSVARMAEAIKAAIAAEGGHLIEWNNAFHELEERPLVRPLCALVMQFLWPRIGELKLDGLPEAIALTVEGLKRVSE